MYNIYNNSLDYSGNNTTLNRISNLCGLKITNKIKNNIIGIHLYKFGKYVINKNINFIVIVGGTDINEYIYHKDKFNIIINCLRQAKNIVVFNKYIKNKLELLEINLSKIKVIPQSIPQLKITKLNLKEYLNIKCKRIYVIIGNLRPVKDPLYLIKEYQELYRKLNYVFVFIGKDNDNKYKFSKGIYHINGLEQNKVYSCIQQANGLINTSIDEGMAISILEAMKLKTPVYVRNNLGNKSIVKHNYNGFIFNSRKEFINLLNKNTEQIVKNAYHYVNNFHNTKLEKLKYNKLFTPI
jgi:glycosyltransferase involved in cell wall biosynthesis